MRKSELVKKEEKSNDISGWICLDKPSGMSSNRAMMKVRKMFGCKAGYVGTLDPFATGVLPIALGETRKFIPYVSETQKNYIFTMEFGSTTDTLDKDGEITETSTKIPNESEIAEILSSFLGDQDQMPPIFSAIKIMGKRACDRVRSGEVVMLSSRKVHIFSISLIAIRNNEADLQVTCSKGTYVRSLARDIAEKLGTVAYVKSLRRIKSGFFSINNAITLEKLLQIKDTSVSLCCLLSHESPLDDIPALRVSKNDVVKLQNGLHVSCANERLGSTNVLIFEDHGGSFAGIGFFSDDGTVKPVRMCVFN